MTDADVFGKLSRIFETHALGGDDGEDLENLLEDFDPQLASSLDGRGTLGRTGAKSTETAIVLPDRPTPFEVWQSKQKIVQKKPTPKLSGQEWDRLVDKMHQSNKTRQSEMIKDQNHGLAAELGGYQFKPRINKTSLDLSATMKSLHVRMPEMLEERKKFLETKRKENAEAEVVECSFHPTRYGEKVSNTYLRKLGREKATPEDFFRYENERQKRNEVRKQIMDEIQDKELTFKPRMDGNSVKIQEKLKNAGLIGQDPVTKTTLVCTSHKSALSSAFSPSSKEKIHRNSSANNFNSKMAGTSTDVDPRSNSSTHRDSAELYEGPTLIIESEHPYRHNTSEYTTVQVPGAVSYAITFSEETHTESVYDYIKFFDDDTHTYHFGAGKYCGGTNNTPCNWPGLGNRPPLIIPSSKFIIYFKTNGSVNDWGFRMHVVPTLRSVSPTGADSSYRDDGFHSPRGNPQLFAVSRNPRNISASSVNDTGIPTISTLGKNYNSPERRVISSKGKIHERLYRQGVQRHMELHNNQVELVQSKLNLSLKPWEGVRAAGSEPQHIFVKLNSKTHLPKATLSEAVAELIEEAPENGEEIRASRSAGIPSDAYYPKTDDNPYSKFETVEFDDSLAALWKTLRTN